MLLLMSEPGIVISLTNIIISYHSVTLSKEPFSSCSPFDTPRSSGITDEGEFEATHLLAVSLVNAEIIHGIWS